MEMDGNRGIPDLEKMEGWDGDRNAVRIRAFSEMSGVTLDSSAGEDARAGRKIVSSISTAWTNEKHSSYLNSIEALFVEQLHNHEYPSMHLHGWLLKRRPKLLDLNSRRLNASAQFSSSQYKVQHRGPWERLSPRRARSRLDAENESCLLLANPWIQRLKSASAGKGAGETSPDPKENHPLAGRSVPLVGKKHGLPSSLAARSSGRLPPSRSNICRQETIGSNEAGSLLSLEMSDQNFLNECYEQGDRLNSPCNEKIMKKDGERIGEQSENYNSLT